MISAILAIAIGQYPMKISVLELPDPGAETVAIHAYLWRDQNLTQEEDAWRVICDTIGINSTTYAADEVSFFGGTTGVLPRVVSAPDFLRLEVVSTPEKWRESVALAASLVAQPNWRSNQWEEREKVLRGSVDDPWEFALWPKRPWSSETLQVDEPSSVHARLLDKGGLRIVVSGPIEQGLVKEELDRVTRTWSIPEYRKVSRFAEETAAPDRQPYGVSTFELTGRPIRIGEKGSGAQFLAATALGVGKGASIWQTVRERDGLAYRVEGVFWPSRSGFVPRFLMLRKSEEAELKFGGDLIAALKESASSLDVVEFARAKVMAEQVLMHPNAFASVYVDGESPLFGLPHDDVRWRGLLHGMGLPSLPLARWSETLNEVTLDDFRAAAVEMVDRAEIRITRGYPGLD